MNLSPPLSNDPLPFPFIPCSFLSSTRNFQKSMVDGVHHWDENGLPDPQQEPPEIQKIHREMVEFVQVWLKDFKRKD